MGLIVSRFRRKRTTFQVLEELEKSIRSIEQYGYSTEQQRRRVIGVLMVFSIGLYILSVILFYFYFRLTSWKEVLLYSTPLLVFPIIVVVLRAVLTRYYEWKLKKNKTQLIDMRAEKKKILEEVKDKETYKYAKEILDKFGDTKEVFPAAISDKNNTPVKIMPASNALATPAQLRQRQVGPVARMGPLNNSAMAVSNNLARPGINNNPMTPMRVPQLPRPVLSASGGAFDRLVDYLVGDGPGSRYALICSQCLGHNGMALPEEFEYLSYRCAYCQYPNAAKKQKPKAPPLVTTPVHNKPSAIEARPAFSSTDSDDSGEERKTDKDSDTDIGVSPLDPPTMSSDAGDSDTQVAQEETKNPFEKEG